MKKTLLVLGLLLCASFGFADIVRSPISTAHLNAAKTEYLWLEPEKQAFYEREYTRITNPRLNLPYGVYASLRWKLYAENNGLTGLPVSKVVRHYIDNKGLDLRPKTGVCVNKTVCEAL